MLKAKITSSLTSATVNEKKKNNQTKRYFFLVPNIAEDIEKQFWPPAWQ